MRRSVLAATGLIVLTMLLSTPLRAGTIRADRPDSLYTQLAADPKYQSVGMIQMVQNGLNYLASGVVVAPNWVLTAAHVVDTTTSLTFTVGGTAYQADSWIPFPDWHGNLSAGNDIGLVHFGVTPIKDVVAAALYTGGAETGLLGTAVGYGNTGTGKTGYINGTYGTKRAGQNVLDKIVNQKIIETDFDNPTKKQDSSMGSSSPVNLEYMIAPGDSGGGLFVDVNNQAYLAGVTSFLSATDHTLNSDYGDVGGFTRVSPYVSWIDGYINSATAPASALGNGGTPIGAAATPADATSIVPEPASLALLALGGLALLGRRRAPRA